MDKDNNAVSGNGKKYPGVAINKADHNKVDKELVKERTRTLDSNPRNDDR
ncbi:MAG: hypothetical protein J6C67_05210 [Muribaculaceae bacterium]|nr:hypothetical protein [Muribaculaceae bacterium]